MREVVLTQTFPSSAYTTAGKGLFIERSPHIAVTTTYAFVVITSSIIPQTVVMIEHQDILFLHVVHHRVDAVGQPLPFSSGNKACYVGFSRRQEVCFQLAAPPRNFLATTYHQSTIGYQTTILQSHVVFALLRQLPVEFQLIN